MWWIALVTTAATAEPVDQHDVDGFGQALEATVRLGCTPESLGPFVADEALIAPRSEPGAASSQQADAVRAEILRSVSASLCELWAGAEPDHGYVAEASDPARGALIRVPIDGPGYRDKTLIVTNGLIATDPRQLERATPPGPWLRYYRFGLGRHDGRVVATRIEVLHLGQEVTEIARLVSTPIRRTGGMAALPRDEALLEARLWLNWGNVRAKVPWARRATYVLPGDLVWASSRSIPVTCEETDGATRCQTEKPTGWVLWKPSFGRRALKILDPLHDQDPGDLAASLDAIRAAGRISTRRLDQTAMEVERRFVGDPSVSLVALNAFVQRGDFDAAHAALEDLQTHLGPDPYLDVVRCEVALERGRWGEGQRHCASAVEQQPGLVRPYWTMIRQAVIRGEHAVIASWLNRVRSATEGTINERDLDELPYLEQFLASPDGQQMLQDWRHAAALQPG